MKIGHKRIDAAINNKFKKPLKEGIKKNLLKLSCVDDIKHKETINLLTQADNTLNNVYMLINNNNLVDANSLMRASLEYIMMGMLIQFDNEDEEVFNEFKNLSIKERDKTKIIHMIRDFKKHLNTIGGEFFGNINNRDKGHLFKDLYDKLCNFTHSSLIMSMMVEIKKNDDLLVFKLISYQNYYFLRILLFYCLKYLSKDNYYYLDVKAISFTYLLFFCATNLKVKNLPDIMSKYSDFLYVEDNYEYFNKNEKNKEKIKENFLFIKEISTDEEFKNDLLDFLKI